MGHWCEQKLLAMVYSTYGLFKLFAGPKSRFHQIASCCLHKLKWCAPALLTSQLADEVHSLDFHAPCNRWRKWPWHGENDKGSWVHESDQRVGLSGTELRHLVLLWYEGTVADNWRVRQIGLCPCFIRPTGHGWLAIVCHHLWSHVQDWCPHPGPFPPAHHIHHTPVWHGALY